MYLDRLCWTLSGLQLKLQLGALRQGELAGALVFKAPLRGAWSRTTVHTACAGCHKPEPPTPFGRYLLWVGFVRPGIRVGYR